MKRTPPLSLAAADKEDLAAMSALLQDMVIKVGDMAHLPNERRFALMGNRYRWENKPRFMSPGERVRTGVHFSDVTAVKVQNIRMEAKDAVLNFLDMVWEEGEEGGALTLVFSGAGSIRLEADAINAELHDVSDPWRASRRPRHEDS